MIISKKTPYDDVICEMLNKFQKNGWDLAIDRVYLDILPGYTIFYDEKLDKPRPGRGGLM